LKFASLLAYGEAKISQTYSRPDERDPRSTLISIVFLRFQMVKKIYKITNDPKGLDDRLARTEHVVTKHSDGSFYCEKHRCPADQCSKRADSDVVWFDRLDGGTFTGTVIRQGPYVGTLLLTRGDRNVLEKRVEISYDAPYGPDGEDVLEWKRLCLEAADSDYRRNGRPTKK
jgi:hypothetical protein